MKLTTIQLYEDTKKKLEQKKITPRETYNDVIKRILEQEEIPSLEEAFRRCDQIKQKRKYSTQEIVNMCHDMRSDL